MSSSISHEVYYPELPKGPAPYSQKCKISTVALGLFFLIGGLALSGGLFPSIGARIFSIAAVTTVISLIIFYRASRLQTHNPEDPYTEFESNFKFFDDSLQNAKNNPQCHPLLTEEQWGSLIVEPYVETKDLLLGPKSFPDISEGVKQDVFPKPAHIQGNASYADSQIIFLNEPNHADPEIHIQQSSLIFSQASEGDVILMEGIQSMAPFSVPEGHWINQKKMTTYGWDERKWAGREERMNIHLEIWYLLVQSLSFSAPQAELLFFLRKALSYFQKRREYRTQIRNQTLFHTIHHIVKAHPGKKIFICCGGQHGRKKEIEQNLGKQFKYSIVTLTAQKIDKKEYINYYS